MREKNAVAGIVRVAGKALPNPLTLGFAGLDAATSGSAYYRRLQDPQAKSRSLGGAAPGAVPMKKVSEVLREKLEKQAGSTPPMSWGNALKTVGAITAAAGAIEAGGQGVGALHTKFRAMRMFNELKSKHKEVANNPKAKEYFDLIVAYAPSLLRHRTAVGDFLMRQLEYPTSSIEFIKQLADLEKTVSTTAPSGSGLGNVASGFKPTDLAPPF